MVRIENYRVIKKLMLVAKPNVVLNHFFDHMGDKRSLIREDVLNIVMYALLTFPSNEFDLKVCIFFDKKTYLFKIIFKVETFVGGYKI